MLKVETTPLSSLYVITPKIVEDARGFFMEVYREDLYREQGLVIERFVQQNHSRSGRGILRGLHFQYDAPLGKLIRVINGQAFLAAVDIRKQSQTLGQWFGLDLSAENKKAIYVPPGFASGFAVTGDIAEVEYLYTAVYNQAGESNIIWNDPAVGIKWPITADPILSDRDKGARTLDEWLKTPESDLF
ncbi:MAG: dTDP-4-dehydrorhamnose 3,5-epimerase [bacterium]|nr:dTDP-4-dehydrorhamnose 3,5-epimerase [bacterium]